MAEKTLNGLASDPAVQSIVVTHLNLSRLPEEQITTDAEKLTETKKFIAQTIKAKLRLLHEHNAAVGQALARKQQAATDTDNIFK